MDNDLLQTSINSFKGELFKCITTACYNGKNYQNGHEAKQALIRSQTLIHNIHESVKNSFFNTLQSNTKYSWTVHPPIGQCGPELKIYGKIKGKDQDIVYLRNPLVREKILFGPNLNEFDKVGLEATKRSIVIGVRSQMSSVEKNFDTLMERAFAETLNLRLRVPEITMGEVYVLPIFELNHKAMLKNEVVFSNKKTKVEKFVRTFYAFSGRTKLELDQQYKYDASALVLVDLKESSPKIIFNRTDLKSYGYRDDICEMFDSISAQGFNERLVTNYNNFQFAAGL